MFHHLMLAIGLALLVLLLALLGPELDRLLAGQLPAFLPLRGRLRLEQWRLTAGHHLPEGHLEALAPAVVTQRLEMQHLAAITNPAFLGRERRAAGPVDDIHLELLRPPPAPNRSGGPCHQSSPGSGMPDARRGRSAPGAAGR